MLVACPSGITWSNQVGGTSCQHPEIEGAFIPLPPEWRTEESDPLYNFYGAYDHRVVELFLGHSFELEQRFEPLDYFPQEEVFGEAWVPLRVKDIDPNDEFASILKDFSGQTVILTYSNSD